MCGTNSITNNCLKAFINAVTYLKDIATDLVYRSKRTPNVLISLFEQAFLKGFMCFTAHTVTHSDFG